MSVGNYDFKSHLEPEVFSTGAERDTSIGKGAFELIPFRPLQRVAIVYERGAEKRGYRNWEKGMPMGRMLQSAIRHIYQRIDGDESEDHLAHAVWNLLGVMHFEEVMPNMNNLPKHKQLRDLVESMAKQQRQEEIKKSMQEVDIKK